MGAESAEEREARLLHVSANQRERLAAESAEEREARLLHVSANQRERLGAESAEEREARLLHVSANQRERRTAESSELTRSSREEPFKQCSVQLKMRKFHEHFTSLSSPKCSTCLERFLGVQLYPSTTECMRCYRDKHTPKLYSYQQHESRATATPAEGEYMCLFYHNHNMNCVYHYKCELIKENSNHLHKSDYGGLVHCTGFDAGGRNVDISCTTVTFLIKATL